MESWIIPVVIGSSVSVGLAIANARQRRANASLAPAILELLQQREMTLPDLSRALGRESFLARGKVALALNELVSEGTVSVIPAPEGTPQLQKVNLIRYALVRAAA